jgi:hypothetical protein
MFGFLKRKKEKPKNQKEALDNASDYVNKGIGGFMAKTFMGKEFVNEINENINLARMYTDNDGRKMQISMTGLGGIAEVLSLEDTGGMVNFDPVVRMKLKVHPQFGEEFETVAVISVSKFSVPRVGDRINIKYNPANLTELIII